MKRKTVLIFITFLFTLALSACGSSGGGGGVPATQPTNLDPSFGANGKVVTEFFSGYDAYAYAMAIQSDDKIVVVGGADNGTDYNFALARYNVNGTLDTSFNTTDLCAIGVPCSGQVVTDFNGGRDVAHAVAIINGGPNNGKIVAAGIAHSGTDNDFALARYNSDGNLDTSFGVGGKVTTPFFNGQGGWISAIALLANGQIVVAGGAYNGTNIDFALARYNEDGSLDASFNNLDPFCSPGFICNGKQRTDFSSNNDYAQAVVIQTDGKIVVSGYTFNATDSDFAMTRYNANGSLDTSFGSAGTGKVTTPFYSGRYDSAYAMTLQTDGKIVVAGYANNGTRKNFALARYNTDGTLDTSFNTQPFCAIGGTCSGQVITDFNGAGSLAYAMTLQTDGKIIAAGAAYGEGGDFDFALARYNTDGSLDTDFGSNGTGMANTNFGSPNDEAYAVALQSDGKIVVAGFSNNGTNYTFALARYLP